MLSCFVQHLPYALNVVLYSMQTRPGVLVYVSVTVYYAIDCLFAEDSTMHS